MADADAAVAVSAPTLTAYIVSVLEALGMSARNAALSADLMVRTDLRGVDSHGIGMLPKYVDPRHPAGPRPGPSVQRHRGGAGRRAARLGAVAAECWRKSRA